MPEGPGEEARRNMDEETKLSVAFFHFTDFVQSFPVLLDEVDVEQYHHIIGLLESALHTDLTRFRIQQDRIKRAVQNPIPGWQAKHPGRVERGHFVGQIWGLAQYLKSNLKVTSPDCRPN
jgi:hypothetical protein